MRHSQFRSYIIFENDLTDDDLVFLPSEFNTILHSYLNNTNMVEKEDEEPTEENFDFLSLKSINQLLYSGQFVKIDSLKEFLNHSNLKKPTHDPVYEIEKKGKKVFVSVWFVSSKKEQWPKDLKSIKARLFSDPEDYGKGLIYFVYDAGNRLQPDIIEQLKKKVNLIYKWIRII